MGKKNFNFGTGLILGALAGAAAVYFLNEDRRKNIKKKVVEYSAKATDELADALENIKNNLEEESKS
jgi:gas vesicle protein